MPCPPTLHGAAARTLLMFSFDRAARSHRCRFARAAALCRRRGFLVVRSFMYAGTDQHGFESRGSCRWRDARRGSRGLTVVRWPSTTESRERSRHATLRPHQSRWPGAAVGNRDARHNAICPARALATDQHELRASARETRRKAPQPASNLAVAPDAGPGALLLLARSARRPRR